MDNLFERVNVLEKKDRKIEFFHTMKTLDWESNISVLKRELTNNKNELKDMQEELIRLKSLFTNIVNELRFTVLKENYVKFKKQINNWPLEEFITRDEFERLIK